MRGFFHKDKHFSLPIEVATIIAQLTCFNGVLPQGAPSSPIIANLICRIFDFRILYLAKKYKLTYTRYADDLTFSTNDKYFPDRSKEFLADIKREAAHAGFEINEQKIRLQYKDSRQVVTGLVTNSKVNVSQQYYKTTRAMAYSLYSTGKFTIDAKQGTLAQLEGRFSFINHVTQYNNSIDKQQHSFYKLSAREKEFSRFLFYKYFYQITSPLIVTEGKTDIRYIKAALQNLYFDYPQLISKNNNKFEFKFSFFRRTKQLQYFLNISPDGADSLINICHLFIEPQKDCRFYQYFLKFGEKQRPPIILIFDNELKKGKNRKPLAKFISQMNIPDDKVSFLKENYYLKLDDEANLYIATHELAEGKDECEIENLFLEETLNHKIDGKSFSLKDSDPQKYYSKEIFSKYILNNYRTIDFKNFRSLLTALVKIVAPDS